jgi:hypothetical protein
LSRNLGKASGRGSDRVQTRPSLLRQRSTLGGRGRTWCRPRASPRDVKPAFLPAIAASVMKRAAGRVGQAVERGHYQRVAAGDLGEGAAELAAAGLGAARYLAEHPGAPAAFMRLNGRKNLRVDVDFRKAGSSIR